MACTLVSQLSSALLTALRICTADHPPPPSEFIDADPAGPFASELAALEIYGAKLKGEWPGVFKRHVKR